MARLDRSSSAWLIAVCSLLAAIGVPGQSVLAAPPRTCELPATKLIAAVPWAQKRLDLERIAPITQGAGIVVAVIDTGVDAAQPFLSGHVLPGQDVINGAGPADTDCGGHGTFIAGLIAGQHREGIGFAGVAPQAMVLPIRQANTGTDGTPQSLATSIRAAVDLGAQVINVSITTPALVPAVTDAVRYALDRNIAIVAAAGNDFQQGNPTQYPAAYPGVIAVGAVGTDDQATNFSETDSGVSVVAPGVDLIGPGAGGPGMVQGQQGTSFAAAYVTGVVALVRAYRPNLTVAQVKHRLEATADHPAATLPDHQLGFGEINPYDAVTSELPDEYGRTSRTVSESALPRLPNTPIRTRAAAMPALATAAGIGLACILMSALGIALPAGQRRGWRPGQRTIGAWRADATGSIDRTSARASVARTHGAP
jgi:membrane-anchored mycosin MYCP